MSLSIAWRWPRRWPLLGRAGSRANNNSSNNPRGPFQKCPHFRFGPACPSSRFPYDVASRPGRRRRSPSDSDVKPRQLIPVTAGPPRQSCALCRGVPCPWRAHGSPAHVTTLMTIRYPTGASRESRGGGLDAGLGGVPRSPRRTARTARLASHSHGLRIPPIELAAVAIIEAFLLLGSSTGRDAGPGTVRPRGAPLCRSSAPFTCIVCMNAAAARAWCAGLLARWLNGIHADEFPAYK